MANCSLCGKEDLCFTCPYCRGVFCAEHRLPESHGCPAIQEAKADARRKIAESFTGQYETEEEQRGFLSRRRGKLSSRRKRFSEQEKKDLMIASLLVLLVGISMMGGIGGGIWLAIPRIVQYILAGLGIFIIVSPVVFLISFMVHEMAHKLTAQHYGMWSEFRMTSAGYYMSAIAIIFSIPIFGTGVVLSSGASSMDEDAKVNLAGPLSSFALSAIVSLTIIAISLAGIRFTIIHPLAMALQAAVILNAMLGLFNMIPVQPFDGGTIFAWNRKIWALLAIALFCLLIFGYLFVGNLLYAI